MKKKVIAIASAMGAGKSTACKIIHKDYKTETIKYSKILTDVLKKLHLENSRGNLQKLSLAFRENFGEDILEKYVLEKIEKSKKKIIILDGVRRKEDYNLIEKKFDFSFIFIEVSEKNRIERSSKRSEKKDEKNQKKEDFQKKENHNSETKIELKKYCDFVLDNNGSLKEFETEVKNTLKKILKNK